MKNSRADMALFFDEKASETTSGAFAICDFFTEAKEDLIIC